MKSMPRKRCKKQINTLTYLFAFTESFTDQKKGRPPSGRHNNLSNLLKDVYGAEVSPENREQFLMIEPLSNHYVVDPTSIFDDFENFKF